MKKLASFLLICIVFFSTIGLIAADPASADGVRTYNSPQRCQRLLALQFGGSANNFPTADPSLEGTPLTLTSATGISGADGIVTVSLGAGFTAPVTLTAYQWQLDTVNTSKAGWRRIGAAAADYSCAFDAHYTSRQFSISERTPYLIRSSAAITGDVYVGDAGPHGSNANSASGY